MTEGSWTLESPLKDGIVKGLMLSVGILKTEVTLLIPATAVEMTEFAVATSL